MDEEQRQLPESRKVLEYKVYWLKRKLAFQNANKQRDTNSVTIEALPASPIKELMHLNNEFHRANEHCGALREMTEKLNQDAVTLNERSEQNNEVITKTISDSKLLNQQSQQLQNRVRRVNRESIRSIKASQATHKDAVDSIKTSEAQSEESKYLSGLTRAQHTATDALNTKTHDLNREAINTITKGITLNRHLESAWRKGDRLNQYSLELQQELKQTRAEIMAIGAESRAVSKKAKTRIARVESAVDVCLETFGEAKESINQSYQILEQGEELFQRTEMINELTESNLTRFDEISEGAIQQQNECKTMNDTLRRTLCDDVQQLEQLTKTRIEDFAHKQRQKISDHLEHNRSETETQITKNLHDCENLIEDRLQESSTLIADVAQDGRLLTRETVDEFQKKSSTSLEKFNTDSTDSIDHFKAHSTDNLETAQNELEILSARFRQDLERSEDLVTDNEKVNEISTALSEKTTDLNATTTHLHEKCGELIGEINGAINTINLANEKLNKESVALQQQSSNLNDETRKLHKNSLVINDQSLSIQKESVSTQELSQEINSHSLSLHEEARLVSLDFDRLNTENREMIHELVELKIQLTQQSVQIRDQQFDCRETTETAENLNRTSSTLNVETQLLNHQTLETLKDAEHTITKTERLNKASIALAEEIRDAQKKLVLVGADVQGASNAARKATAEAERSTARSQQIQETLITSVSEMEDLKQDTEEELSHLQKIKDDAIEDFESSKEAQKQLQLCINESRQINNEFMLGLEVAQDSHQHTNDHANAILEKCKGLQTEIRSLLSVANGIDEFQSNIDRCQHRLDQYSDNLASCHNTTSAHTELLDECQTRIDEYQGEIQQCRESVTLMDSRAKRLEGYFSGYEKRLNILETNQDNSLEDSFNEQVLKMRALETDIRTGFRNNQERLEQNLSKLKSSLDSRFATLGEELMRRVGKEIETRNEPIHKKIDVTNKTMSNLSTSFEELNRSITSEVNKLREESLEVRRQNRDLQVKNQSVRREHNETISKQGHEIQELKNRLRNYQTLLQTQIDTSSTNILDDRIDDLESSVKSQQQILESHASFNVEISDTVNDESKQMNVMVNKFGRSMEDAIETNKTLKVEIETARKTNRQLASANEQLQEQMQSSLEKRDVIMQDYSDRLGGMEHRERGYLTTIDDLKSHETDTNLGMHQMLLALKESTEAMKDTQKTLEKYKDHGVSRSLDEPQGMTWLGSSKQAVVSVLCAVAFTGLTMFGYQKVDASVNETHDNLVASATKFNPLDSMPFQRLDTAESSLQSISRASSSIALLGTFSWPVNVGIVDPNDIRYQPHRRGISISAELGDPVVSVNDGTVIYSADEIRGYGNVIVIQHDENLVSVYANNQYNYVQKGDKVRRGQLIGDVGLLFNQDEAGLYFEIRYMGTPEDPFNYLGHSIESSLLDLAIQ